VLNLGVDAIAAGTIGMLLVEDADSRTLVACDSIPNPADAKISRVVQIDVTDVANPAVLSTNPLQAIDVDANVFCNDVAVDSAGNLYATDSFGGQVQRIAAGEVDTDATPWFTDALLEGNVDNPFGANGIVVLGDGTNEFVFVVNFAEGTLNRIAINADGTAGEIVTLALTNSLGEAVVLRGPDGLKAIDGSTLLVVENAGNSLTRIDLDDAFGAAPTGKTTVMSSRLDVPTTVAIDGSSALVVEGQLDHLLDPTIGPAALPFRVVRVQLY
jgi:hypothetical protein